MNWWFTNQAIILDTAGRLMFEEVAPGSTNEWNEFLKLLKGNRPNCPINGMLLVIPVDTLIKDTADSIEKKAGKIAQQFDQIQRTLGVRFPVFIIISKCDLLNGFREFFDDLNDPQLQHQMMGWSNPAPLDERFDPTAVVNHLDTVKTRLTERRQQLLLDPVNTEDPQGRRVDQIDALYALPDSITKIAPRLRRYLEMIFVAGEWSPKPLFLRGIYFTSSMTEGSALDAELADVLGVPVDSLPEGRVWRRDRAYFLRDLFIEKVFREKGLVTRADNADKQQRTRRAIVITCGFLAVLLLGALTWFGSRQLENSIGVHRDFWLAAANNAPSQEPVIDLKKDNAYVPSPPFTIRRGEDTTIAQFFGKNLKLVQDEIKIPVIFKPMTLLGGNVNGQRHEAYRAYYEATILAPVYTAVRRKLPTLTDATWSDDATGALAQLMKLEYASAAKKLPEGETHPQVDIDPLFKVILRPADVALFTADEPGLQQTADWIYSPEADGTKAWPAALLAPAQPANLAVIDQGVTTTIAYWKRQTTDGAGMANILAVRTALKDFRQAEDELLRLKTHPVEKIEPYNTFLQQWQAGLARLSDARNRATAAWAAAGKGAPDTVTLKTLYTAEIARIADNARHAYEMLLKFTPDAVNVADVAKPDASPALLADRQKLTAAITDLNDWKTGPSAQATLTEITDLDTAYLAISKGPDDAQHRRFEVQAQLYELADTFLVKAPATQPTVAGAMGDALNGIDNKVATADAAVDKVLVQATTGDRLEAAGKLSEFTIDVGARCHKYYLVKGELDNMPTDPDKWADYIGTLAASIPPERMFRPQVPLVAFTEKTFPARFAPDAVGSVTEALTAFDHLANDPNGAKVLDAAYVTSRTAAVKKNFQDYLGLYVKYWKEDAFNELAHYGPNTWTEFSTAISNLRERTVRISLEEYGDKCQKALAAVGDSADASGVQSALLLGQKKDFQGNCSDALSNWKDLGDNYRQCRRVVLAMQPSKFMEQYSVDAGTDDGFVARYWQRFAVEAIHVLANDSRTDILGGLKDLAAYERFPLAAAADPKLDLSAADLVSARAALEKVVGSADTSATSGAKSIGSGSPTRNKELDAELDALRGTNLLRDKLTYLAQLQRFITALPADAKPMSVAVTVLKDKLKDDNSISQKYAYMVMMQGPKLLHTAFLGGMVSDRTDVEYAGPDLVLQFKDIPQGPVIQTETFNGPWSPFRFLSSPNVKSVTRDANKWTVEYLITDSNKKTWSLWLLLEFKTEVPDLKDWPVSPGK